MKLNGTISAEMEVGHLSFAQIGLRPPPSAAACARPRPPAADTPPRGPGRRGPPRLAAGSFGAQGPRVGVEIGHRAANGWSKIGEPQLTKPGKRRPGLKKIEVAWWFNFDP